jgi:hypothetical protein
MRFLRVKVERREASTSISRRAGKIPPLRDGASGVSAMGKRANEAVYGLPILVPKKSSGELRNPPSPLKTDLFCLGMVRKR